jgi:hypothetical protein
VNATVPATAPVLLPASGNQGSSVQSNVAVQNVLGSQLRTKREAK